MSTWEVIWLSWFGIFLVVEGIALARKEEGDTLSEYVWRLFSTKRGGTRTRTTQLRRFVLLSFMAWLTLHFLSGGWV